MDQDISQESARPTGNSCLPPRYRDEASSPRSPRRTVALDQDRSPEPARLAYSSRSPPRYRDEASSPRPSLRATTLIGSLSPNTTTSTVSRSPRRPDAPLRSISNTSSTLRYQSSYPPTSVVLQPTVGSEATRDELLALGRQSRYLERRLQVQLDAQSAGLLAGLGLDDNESSTAGSEVSPGPLSRTATVVKPQRGDSPTNAHQAWSTPMNKARRFDGPSGSAISPPPEHPPSLPATRRAIYSTLLEFAQIKRTEAAAHATTLEPLDRFLVNTTSLEQRKAGLEAAIAEQETPAARTALDNLADEEMQLRHEVQELEDTLATKRARLRHVQRRHAHDASTLDSKLSSWRGAMKEVDTRIKNEVLTGRGLPSYQGQSTDQPRSGDDVWALPLARRTLGLVRESVQSDRAAIATQHNAANREADACIQGAGVWQGAVEAVREVERALRREMRRLRGDEGRGGGLLAEDDHTAREAAPRKAIPLATLPSTDYDASYSDGTSVTASFATAHTRSGSGTESILPSSFKTMPSHNTSATRTILAHMDKAIAGLTADVALAADNGWKLLVVAIGAELAALREGRSVLGGGIADQAKLGGPTGLGGEEIELVFRSPARPVESPKRASDERRNSQTTPTPRADLDSLSLVPELSRGDTEDDSPSLDLLVEAA